MIADWIGDWLKGLLIDSILENLGGLFDSVNDQVGEIAAQVGKTPGQWNPGVFALIKNLSETVVLPIAGLVLTFVATWELINLIIEKNNMQEFDTFNIFKWVFKTAVAIMILSNTWNIVMAVFDVAQNVVNDASGLIGDETAISSDIINNLRTELELMEVGPLLGLWMQSFLIKITMLAMNIAIFVVVWGRMIQIYMQVSLAPIPLATLTNREYGQMGQNYLKALCAVGFQGFLIMVCIAIYAVLIKSIAVTGDPMGAIWAAMGYTVLLCYTLFKTGSLANSIFGAH